MVVTWVVVKSVYNVVSNGNFFNYSWKWIMCGSNIPQNPAELPGSNLSDENLSSVVCSDNYVRWSQNYSSQVPQILVLKLWPPTIFNGLMYMLKSFTLDIKIGPSYAPCHLFVGWIYIGYLEALFLHHYPILAFKFELDILLLVLCDTLEETLFHSWRPFLPSNSYEAWWLPLWDLYSIIIHGKPFHFWTHSENPFLWDQRVLQVITIWEYFTFHWHYISWMSGNNKRFMMHPALRSRHSFGQRVDFWLLSFEFPFDDLLNLL